MGRVPTHWEILSLGQVGTLTKGTGGNKEDELPTGMPCVRYGDLYTTHKYFVENARSFIAPEVADQYTKIKFGDVLFAASGETADEIGKSAVNLLKGPAYCGGDVILFRPHGHLIPRYTGYMMDCEPIVHQKATMGRGFTVYHIYGKQLKYLRIPIPPPEEQTAIVRFLDHADEQIKSYIVGKERLIALLEEERQAVIHQAVTRGLDPNVRLKPSGVEWLGNMPEHWEIRRSKRLFSPRQELAKPNDIQLSATQAYGVIPQDEYEQRVGRRVVKISLHLEKRQHVEVDDFVISMRSFEGGLERTWTTGCIRSSYVVLRPAIEIDVEFFSYLFKSQTYIQTLQSTANFIRDGQDLNFHNFCAVDLPFPPTEEQRRMAVALMEATANIDTTIARSRRQINLMNEYRTRLIADVVTGQLDVREAAEKLPTPEPTEITD